MFGKVREVPQTEQTPFHPRSPYGVAKAYGHYITVNYRESYGLYAVSGILFNHESPRRGLEFVTRKISDGVARIKLGLADELRARATSTPSATGASRATTSMRCGGCSSRTSPDDYVVATGETHSVREFAEIAFSHVGLDWEQYVKTDPQFLRPAEVDRLVGDSSKARSELGWDAEALVSRSGRDDGGRRPRTAVTRGHHRYRRLTVSAVVVDRDASESNP